MLFDFALASRKNFVHEASAQLIEPAVAGGPQLWGRAQRGVEWLAEDASLMRYMYNCGLVRDYAVVGEGYDRRTKESFGVLSPYERVSVDFPDWQPGERVSLKGGTADFAVCTQEAAERLSQDDALGPALKETARILKADGRLVFFWPLGDSLPDGAEESFRVNSTMESQEWGLTAHQLVPRLEAGAKLVRRRRRVAE